MVRWLVASGRFVRDLRATWSRRRRAESRSVAGDAVRMARRLKHKALVGEQAHRLADRLAGVAGVAADIGNGRQRVARPEYPVDDLLPEPIRYLPIWPRVREFAVAHNENNTRSHSSLVDYNCVA